MATYTIIMMGYLHTAAEYHDPEKILRTLTSVAEQGYLITTSDDAFSSWHAERPLEPGIAPALHPHLKNYLEGKESHFAAEAIAVDVEGRRREFKYLCLALVPREELLVVTVDDWYFTLPGDLCQDPQYQREARALYTHWLDLLQLTYGIWHPLYCFESAAGLWPDTGLADARTLQPQHLYQYNYFGPELVEKIGRERLLNAPAWQIRHFADGGALVIPNDLYYGEQRSDNMLPVAQALRLSYDTQALERLLARRRPRPGGNTQS